MPQTYASYRNIHLPQYIYTNTLQKYSIHHICTIPTIYTIHHVQLLYTLPTHIAHTHHPDVYTRSETQNTYTHTHTHKHILYIKPHMHTIHPLSHINDT